MRRGEEQVSGFIGSSGALGGGSSGSGERGEKEVSAVGEEGGDPACGGVGTSGGNHKS